MSPKSPPMGLPPQPTTLLIDIPPKVWRPKPTNIYHNDNQTPNDVDEDLYLFPSYGRGAIFRQTTNPFDFNIKRDDRIIWNPDTHSTEFAKVVRFAPDLNPKYKTMLTRIIQDNWDSFTSVGVNRPVLDYEFCIDAGSAKPVACKPVRCGVHEAAIMTTQLQELLNLGWISPFSALTGWLSMIVLAPKPHQEHIIDIEDFIWRLCVNYRGLNSVTLPHSFPIPRCDQAVDNFAPGAGRLFWISVDAKSGFHQISVRHSDREKLCFAGPNGLLVTFNVMPFGPLNGPACCSALMCLMRQEWQALFRERFPELTDTDIETAFIQSGDRQIVDDILIFSNDPTTLLLYFECVCHIFTKWRLSFNPKKCDYFLDRVEWIGFDLRPQGNSPASSKFDSIRDWPLPTQGTSLHSFVGLLNFYSRFIPNFELRVGPLRLLVRRFHRKTIPASEWTPPLRAAFDDLKTALLSDPLLRRCDSSLPTFIKTDWSKTGMSLILMQPEDSAAALVATKLLSHGNPSSVTFDLTLEGVRLQPVFSASRRCTPGESDYHGFVGEIATGRWGFALAHHYLWGTQFFWICDCNAVDKIANCSGPSHMLRRWNQELFACNWTSVHRNAAMMGDVDALTRGRYLDSLAASKVNSYLISYESFLADALTAACASAPAPFDPDLFPTYTTKCPTHHPDATNTKPLKSPTPSAMPATLCSLPVFMTLSTAPPKSTPLTHHASHVALRTHLSACWISLNCHFGTITTAVQRSHPTMCSAPFLLIEPSPILSPLLSTLFPHHTISAGSESAAISALLLQTDNADPTTAQFLQQNRSLTGVDWTCTASDHNAARTWLTAALTAITALSTSHNLQTAILTSRSDISGSFPNILPRLTPPNWDASQTTVRSSCFGDAVCADRWICTLSRSNHHPNPTFSDCLQPTIVEPIGCGAHIMQQPPTTAHFTQSATTAGSPTPHHHPLSQPLPLATEPPLSHVYHPLYPAPEPHPASSHVCHPGFGITTSESAEEHTTYRRIQPSELAAMHSLNPLSADSIQSALLPVLHLPLTATIQLFRTTMPGHTADAIASALVDSTLSPLFDTIGSHAENVLSCTISPTIPPSSEWESGYQADPTLEPTHSALRSNPNHSFPESFLRTLPASYQAPLRDHHISLKHNRLTYLQPLSRNGRALLLIIPPTSLRRRLFETLHSSPSSGHLMSYKTLHRIRLRFYWHKLRSDVDSWLKTCPDCILANSTIRRGSELVYSWPTSSPFAILHVDIWQAGATPNCSGSSCILGAMCDLTGFTIIVDIDRLDSATLAEAFMKHVLLRIGFCLLIAPDAGTHFMSHFVDMCKTLKVACDPALKSNHQSASIERFFRFLNKAVKIAIQQRSGDTKISSESAHCATCAWNASAIDGTDIIRSVPAIGRPFRFPIDCELSELPPITTDDTRVRNLHEFLRLGQTQSAFATEILALLTEERRFAAAAHTNARRNPNFFKEGDIVVSTVQVQSNAANNTVAKLSYSQRGPQVITKVLGHGGCEVRGLHSKPHSKPTTVHGSMLNLLPPSLWPCSPTDGPDQRFLDLHVPELPISIRRPLGCDSYNQHFFDSSNQPPPLPSDHPPPPASPLQDAPTGPLSATTELDPSLTSTTTPDALHSSILDSTDKLFFIAYRFQTALRPKFAAIQVDLEQTTSANLPSGHYYCHFLSSPSADSTLPEQHRRWWPIWHQCTTNPEGIIQCGTQVEFSPATNPPANKYIAWADTINLSDPGSLLAGPFNFIDPQAATDKSRTPSHRQFIPIFRWTELKSLCLKRGVIAPALQPTTRSPSARRRLKRKQSS